MCGEAVAVVSGMVAIMDSKGMIVFIHKIETAARTDMMWNR
jgi:EAL domain-containing protein (putative c-di-GMP-specific phosphodiesterase class I)